MRLKPILFDTEMVRALLEGRKTVTRRVVKPQPVLDGHLWKLGGAAWRDSVLSVPVMLGHSLYDRAPYQPDDVLWVRETFRVDYLSNIVGSGRVRYKADGSYADIHFSADRYDMMRRAQRKPGWRPNENMPREVARIFLRVTDIRAERLREITKIEAQQEGQQECTGGIMACGGSDSCLDCEASYQNALRWFSSVWDSTIKSADRATCGWEANPWVWVIAFERVEKPAKNNLDGENP